MKDNAVRVILHESKKYLDSTQDLLERIFLHEQLPDGTKMEIAVYLQSLVYWFSEVRELLEEEEK